VEPLSHSRDTVPRPEPEFAWRSFSRYVEVYPVRTGWLVVWGRYERLGAVRIVIGNRTYPILDGVRSRVAVAALALTGSRDLATEATTLFDRHAFPEHRGVLPDPL